MPTRPPSTLAALTLACALASGCEREAKEPTKAEAVAVAVAETGHSYVAGAQSIVAHPLHASTLALVEAGAEPREALRYAVLGSSRRLRLATFIVRNRNDDDHDDHDDDDHALIQVVLSWGGAPTGDESMGYLWAIREVVDEARQPTGNEKMDIFAANLVKMWEQLRGQATGTSAGLSQVIQTRGASPSPSPSVQLYSFATPLPSEAVGVGAVWTRTTRHDQASVEHKEREMRADPDGPALRELLPGSKPRTDRSLDELTQIERYTLVERQGELLTIDYDMRVESDEPGAAPRQTASGRFLVSLADPVAQAGTFEIVDHFMIPAREGREPETHESRQRIELETL